MKSFSQRLNNIYCKNINKVITRFKHKKTNCVFVLFIFFIKISVYSQTPTYIISETGGKYGLKDNKGTTIIDEKYASITILPDDNLLVYEENPGWPLIINPKGETLVSKTNYIGKVLDAFSNHFICQYYKDGQMADLVLIKATDSVLYNFPLKYIHAEFVKDSCYTYVSAQTKTPGEKLSINLNGKLLTETNNVTFDYIKKFIIPCNGLAVVLKDRGYEGILSGVYDFNNKKLIIPCNYSEIEFETDKKLIKAFDKIKTLTYNLYDMNGNLLKTWEQIKK